jgi:hypothetical protein
MDTGSSQHGGSLSTFLLVQHALPTLLPTKRSPEHERPHRLLARSTHMMALRTISLSSSLKRSRVEVPPIELKTTEQFQEQIRQMPGGPQLLAAITNMPTATVNDVAKAIANSGLEDNTLLQSIDTSNATVPKGPWHGPVNASIGGKRAAEYGRQEGAALGIYHKNSSPKDMNGVRRGEAWPPPASPCAAPLTCRASPSQRRAA